MRPRAEEVADPTQRVHGFTGASTSLMPSSICSKLETSLLEVLPAGWRELVAAHAPAAGRHAPARAHASGLEQTLQGGIERAFLDAQQVVRGPLNVLDESVAVQRLLPQHLENHHLQCPGEELFAVARLRIHSSSQAISL